jgi:hypothetical protein
MRLSGGSGTSAQATVQGSGSDICNPRLTSAFGVQHRSRDRKRRARPER